MTIKMKTSTKKLKEDRKDKIYDFLDSHKKETHTAYSISNALSLNLSTVQNLIEEMIQEGSIIREKITENNRLKKIVRIKKMNEYNWQDVRENDPRLNTIIDNLHRKGLSVFIHQEDDSIIEISPPKMKPNNKIEEKLIQVKEIINNLDQKERNVMLKNLITYSWNSIPKYSRSDYKSFLVELVNDFNFFSENSSSYFLESMLIDKQSFNEFNSLEDNFYKASSLKNEIFKFLLTKKIVNNYLDESDLLHPRSSYNQFFILDPNYYNYRNGRPIQLFSFLKKNLEQYFKNQAIIKFHENSLSLTYKNFNFNIYPIIKSNHNIDKIYFPSLKNDCFSSFNLSILSGYDITKKINKEIEEVMEYFGLIKKSPINLFYLKTLSIYNKESKKSLFKIIKEEKLKPVQNPYDNEILIYPFRDTELNSNQEYIDEIISEL